MRHIYFARHGETHANKARLFQDGTEPLSDTGHLQAVQLARRVANIDYQHLVVSDYVRTRETAEPIIMSSAVSPVYSELFREVKRPSSLIGKAYDSEEVQSFYQETQNHFSDPDQYFEDEENPSDVLNRVKQSIDFLESLDGDVLVVTHGLFLHYVLMYVLSNKTLSYELMKTMHGSMRVSNTGITLFVIEEGKWKLVIWNDHAHFAE